MPQKNNVSLALNLAALAAGMLMLAYASVPLYKLFCAVTGYGGTTQEAKSAPPKALDRKITIAFNADTDPNLPWDFKPEKRSERVAIGAQSLAFYTAKNLSNHAVTGRAVYNVVPFAAGSYFVKIDCFCFKEQTLAAGEKAHMPVSFYVDPNIVNDPDLKGIETITLSYTFFAVKK
jgi:cytochrome c oxidase assembly protein subunit 11